MLQGPKAANTVRSDRLFQSERKSVLDPNYPSHTHNDHNCCGFGNIKSLISPIISVISLWDNSTCL